MLARQIDTQTAHENVQENVWSFEGFANSTSTLPFDQHMLAVLAALLLIDNTSIDSLGPESVWVHEDS